MASNGFITPVVDGSGFQNRLGCPKDILDSPERLVDVSYRLGVVDGVSPQHQSPLLVLFGFDLLLIEGEMTMALDFQIPTVTFISLATRLLSPRRVAPLSAQQWPPGRAHPYGALLH
jgi:hypothetical protein